MRFHPGAQHLVLTPYRADSSFNVYPLINNSAAAAASNGCFFVVLIIFILACLIINSAWKRRRIKITKYFSILKTGAQKIRNFLTAVFQWVVHEKEGGLRAPFLGVFHERNSLLFFLFFVLINALSFHGCLAHGAYHGTGYG